MPDLLDDVLKLSKLTFRAVKKAGRKVKRATSLRNDPLHPARPPPDSDVLPLPYPLRKKEFPWYIQWAKNPERISFTEDGAMRFELVAGCHGLCSGAAFRANPHKALPADAATLSYSVYFPPDFDWVKGGKLPGVNIGCTAQDCSTGGAWSDTGGSFRIMFRQLGAAIGYAYMPLPGKGRGAFDAQSPEFKAVSQVKGGAGIDMWHGRDGGDLQLRAGTWNTVSISVRLNTPGQADGAAAVTVNGRTKSIDGVVWRLNDNSRINAVNFVAFFGGGDSAWDSPVDTYMLFKDISFAASS